MEILGNLSPRLGNNPLINNQNVYKFSGLSILFICL